MPRRTHYRSLLSALALFSACGPSNPGQEEASDTSPPGTDTDSNPDPSEDVPTTTEPDSPTGDGPEACGACGTLLEGDVSPTGVAAIDGFVAAAARIRTVQIEVSERFERHMLELAAIYGIPATSVDETFVAQLVAAIQADILAHTADFRAVHVPARCHSDIDIAVLAQRGCEIDAGCGVPTTDDRPPVLCEGACEGTCDGQCTGALSCATPAPSIQCPGACLGGCTIEAGAACDGTCHGDCSGQCSRFDPAGACIGRCDGLCMGTCLSAAPATCAGTCDGICLVEQGDPACGAEAGCRGQCDAQCTGECVGKVIPPSGAPNCAASSLCEAQAGALGSAHVGCRPPLLEFEFTFQVGVDLAARGSFDARIQEVERHGAAVLQDAAQLGVLITGQHQGVVLFDPAPLLDVNGSLAALLAAGVGSFPIPEGRLPCAEPAIQAASKQLADIAAGSLATLQAQAVFAALLTGA